MYMELFCLSNPCLFGPVQITYECANLLTVRKNLALKNLAKAICTDGNNLVIDDIRGRFKNLGVGINLFELS